MSKLSMHVRRSIKMDPSCQISATFNFYLPNDPPEPSSELESRMLQIEWKSSHYHSDGRRRSRPKASTVHGWLVKWRATFSGNEHLRKEGIREMREAKAVREREKQRKAARRAKAGVSKSVFHLWPVSLGKKKRRPQTPKGLPRSSQRSDPKRPSRGSSRHLASPTHSPRLPPPNNRRSNHNRRGAGDRNTSSSRKPPHRNRGDVVRAAERKRRAPT